MTLDEFIKKVTVDGAVCICKTPEECREAMIFLEAVSGFPIFSGSKYHIDQEKMHAHRGFICPGLDEDFRGITCWQPGNPRPHIAYNDIPFDAVSDVDMSADDLFAMLNE